MYRREELYLVLDLDNTLVHAHKVSQLTEAEKYLVEEVDSRDDLRWIEAKDSSGRLIKSRPFAREFLQEANQLFKMSVYTHGSSAYAERMLKFLDPNKTYFGNRIITKSDSSRSKTLDLVLAEERSVVIVDDRSAVWRFCDQRNLMQIERYNYFNEHEKRKKRALRRLEVDPREYFNGKFRSDSEDSRCHYAEEKRDESEKDGALANALRLLKNVHEESFHGEEFTDVRALLRKMTRGIVSVSSSSVLKQ